MSTALPTGEDCDREEPESTNDPATTALGWELGRELTAALQQLSPKHRAVIELTFVEGFSYPQIASIVGCPENTVKIRMFHARRRLAQLLSHLELEGASVRVVTAERIHPEPSAALQRRLRSALQADTLSS